MKPLVVGLIGLICVSAVAEDSAVCKGKRGEIDLTVDKEYVLRVNGEKVTGHRTEIYAKNRAGDEKVLNEIGFSVDNGTSVKTQYQFENWNHCGDVDDVRVRIYDVYPNRKVFVGEQLCECQNS